MAEVRPLVLASASPRRRELLKQVGIEFEVQAPDGVEPQPLDGEQPVDYARRSAEEKARAVSARLADALVLGADTVVVVEGRILGKPRTPAEARAMLSDLSGRRHAVHTGVSVAFDGRTVATRVETTEVFFRALSSEDIDTYVASGEPMDKAGAYGIQGRGALLVERIEGCYSNVVGLPLSRTRQLLDEATQLIAARSGESQC